MSLKRFSPKFFLIFFSVLAAVLAQDSTSYLTGDVMRVGGRLACRCGGCRNTVGDCPMLRCSSADPLRHRIFSLKEKGMSDDSIVDSIVREQGIVALASPPAAGLGPIVTWVMPGVVLLIGLYIYSSFVRRNRKEPEVITATDQSLIDRFRGEMDHELGEDEGYKGSVSSRHR